ncbi:hypothetical protein F2P56_015299 [Juglans regia]|uniref:Retrotransposon Copia-like N-terminal domain-containing protein n=1 Tax=Juglans regia TaxID=51240 RepID=A0A834CMN8_JUGRE|nr:hypothetical protein F2P56_015299 [Juglans regia]
MTSSSSSSPSSLEDQNSPFFLHHSENANTVIVSPPLTGSNYISWSRSFLLSISIKNKSGFLDGMITTPDLSDSSYVSWLGCNNILLAWILNSVSKDIASNVFFMTSAKEVWDKLKERFAQPDEARIYHLQHKLSGIVQGHLSVSDYFTQLNAIWEELHSHRPLPCCFCGKCTCDALKNVGEVQQGDYVFKFLMGLDDSYDVARGQIILLSPLPSLDKTFSLILQEERQRQARNTTLPISEPPALLAYQKFSKKKDKSDLVCHHCGKIGNTKENCYKLVGFPPNFKFTKPRIGNTSAAPYSANQVAAQINAPSHEAPAPSVSQLNLSQAQAHHLMDLVNARFPQLNSGQNQPLLPTPAPIKPQFKNQIPQTHPTQT